MRLLLPLCFCFALGCTKGGVIEVDDEDRTLGTTDDSGATDSTGDITDDTGGGADDTGSVEDTGAEDTGAEDTGVDTGGDTGDTGTEPAVSEYAGDFEGVVVMEALTDFGNFEIAACDVTMTIDAEGGLTGLTICELDFGGTYKLKSDVGGEVDEDGEVIAEMVIAVDVGGGSTYDIPVDIDGESDGDEMALEFLGEIDLGWATADLYGQAALTRAPAR